MKAFYYQVVPARVKDIFKTLGGGQLETVTLINQEDDFDYADLENATEQELAQLKGGGITLEQTGITITDAMRSKVDEGLPLFSRSDSIGGMENNDQQKNTGNIETALIRDDSNPGYIPILVHFTNEARKGIKIDSDGQVRLILPQVFRGDMGYVSARGFRFIEKFLWPYGENEYIRSSNNSRDIEFIKSGTHKGSKNHHTDDDEGGLSVAHAIEYGGKYAAIVRGKMIGQGSDSEPLLDVSTVEFVREITYEKLNSDIQEKAKSLGLTKDDLRHLRSQIIWRKGGDIPVDANQSPRTEGADSPVFQRGEGSDSMPGMENNNTESAFGYTKNRGRWKNEFGESVSMFEVADNAREQLSYIDELVKDDSDTAPYHAQRILPALMYAKDNGIQMDDFALKRVERAAAKYQPTEQESYLQDLTRERTPEEKQLEFYDMEIPYQEDELMWLQTDATRADGTKLDDLKRRRAIKKTEARIAEMRGIERRLLSGEKMVDILAEKGDSGARFSRSIAAGFMTPPSASPWAQENRRIREEDKTLWSKAKTQLRKSFAPGGLLPDSVFREKIARDGKLGVVEITVQGLVRNIEEAVRKDYGTQLRNLSPADMRRLSDALAGKMPANIKSQTKESVLAMRQYIDHLSGQYAQILQDQVLQMTSGFDAGEQALLVGFLQAGQVEDGVTEPYSKDPAVKAANKVKRAAATRARNKIMDAAKEEAKNIWGDGKGMLQALGKVAPVAGKISLMDTILSNQGEYVHRSYQVFDDENWYKKLDDETLNTARQYLMDRYLEDGQMSVSEAESRADVVITDILKNGTAYDSMESFVKESKLGAKDLSVLKRRKDIAPEIRALMGEYVDPRINFAKSATKMGRLIFNQKFLDAVRDNGMGVFLFTEEDRPQDTEQIAAGSSEVYAPLNGLYTYKEVAQAMKDALGTEQMATWYKVIVRVNGMIKGGKTILSPTTSARNFQSAMFFAIANGHFDLTQAKKSMALIGKFDDQQKLDYVKKMKELGVIYDNPYAEEMMDLLRESKADTFFSNNKVAEGIRASWNFAREVYSFGDDFWKIIGFENEKADLMKHGRMTEAQAEKEAAERIRNAYPTYSMVGSAVQWLRRFPLVGTFVSFPAEIIRTSFNMGKLVHKDWSTPGMRPLAAKRALGMSFVAGFAYAAQELAKAAFDIDDEDEEAIRMQASPWQQNSNLVITGRNDDGNLRYIDISFLDPYNYFKRPITAMLRDQPFQDAIVSGARDMISPFLGTDIAAGALLEIYSNKTATGGRVFKESDSIDQQLLDIGDHLRKAIQPGIASNLERTWLAMNDERTAGGKQYDIYDEGLGWIGWRVSTLDPRSSLYYRTFDFSDAKADASRTLTEVLNSPNSVTDDQIVSAYERSMRMRSEAYEGMITMINSSRRSGLSDRDIQMVLRASNVSRADASALLTGRIPPWRPTAQAEMGAVRRAEALIGRDKAIEIRDRYRRARMVETD
jgi:hypothetical protein